MITANRYKNNNLIKTEFEQPSELQSQIIFRILFLHNFDHFIKNSSTKNLENIKQLVTQIKGENK